MKKFLFLGLAAMIAFTSCTKDETLATAQNGAIGFDVAADKATRSNNDFSITTNNIINFAVYGFMNEATGVVFDNEEVSGSNASGWTYQNTQYWTPNTYYFSALAPSQNRKWSVTLAADSAKAKVGIGTVYFTNEGNQDLLYWDGVSDNTQNAAEDAPVSIKFDHLLSKVKFSFVNEFDNENAQIEVLDVKILNADTAANIDLTVEDWTKGWVIEADKTAAFEFGDANSLNGKKVADTKFAPNVELESDNEMLLFPKENGEYKITFMVNLYMNGVLANAKPYEHTVIVATPLEMGKAYDFKATLNAYNVTGNENEDLKPIEFTVTVTDWVEPTEEVEVNYTIYDNQTITDLTMDRDGVVSGTMTVAGTLNGNGYTMTPSNPKVTSDTYRFIELDGAADVTVKGLVIDGKNMTAEEGGKSYGIRGLFIEGSGNYVIDGVTVKNVTYALNTGTVVAGAKLAVKNSTLEGWTSLAGIEGATFTKVNFTKGKYANFKPYTSVTLTDCTFEEGFALDFSALNGVMTLKNCTCKGVVITAENLATCGVVLDTFDAAKVAFK